MTDEDTTINVQPEFDVDVRETLEGELERRGVNASISTYKQPMIVATTRREVEEGVYQSFKIEMPADVVCRQEKLDEIIEQKVDELFDMAGVDE